MTSQPAREEPAVLSGQVGRPRDIFGPAPHAVQAEDREGERNHLIESLPLHPKMKPDHPSHDPSSSPLRPMPATREGFVPKPNGDADGAMIVSLLAELRELRAQLSKTQRAYNRSAGDLGRARKVIRELHQQLQLVFNDSCRGEPSVMGISGEAVKYLAYRLTHISVARDMRSPSGSLGAGEREKKDEDLPFKEEEGGDVQSTSVTSGQAQSCERQATHRHGDITNADSESEPKALWMVRDEVNEIATSLLEEVDRASAAEWSKKSTTADKILASAKIKACAEDEYEELDRVIAGAMEHIDEADASDESKQQQEEVKRKEREEALKMAAWSEEYEKRLFNLEGVFEVLSNRVESLEQLSASNRVLASREADGAGGAGLTLGKDRGEMALMVDDIVVGFWGEDESVHQGEGEVEEGPQAQPQSEALQWHQNDIGSREAEVSVEARLGGLESGFDRLSDRVENIDSGK
ncbi:hypothetical protein IAU59_004694 [Kwoniella sp. CBS 9459]